jgi:hypothetical protein
MMRRLLYINWLLITLDALSTYYIVASHHGMEVNQFLQFINAAPHMLFLIQIFIMSMSAVLTRVFEILAAALPSAVRTWAYRMYGALLVGAVVFRTAAVVNNLAGIVAGVTPLAVFFFS